MTIWNKALSKDELGDLYLNRDGVPDYDDKHVVGAWDFDGMASTTQTFQGYRNVRLIEDRSRGFRGKKNPLIVRPSYGDFPTSSHHVRRPPKGYGGDKPVAVVDDTAEQRSDAPKVSSVVESIASQ